MWRIIQITVWNNSIGNICLSSQSGCYIRIVFFKLFRERSNWKPVFYLFSSTPVMINPCSYQGKEKWKTKVCINLSFVHPIVPKISRKNETLLRSNLLKKVIDIFETNVFCAMLDEGITVLMNKLLVWINFLTKHTIICS